MRRARRQAVTLARAIRAGRARVRANPPQAPNVDGSLLRELLADVAVDVELVNIRVNRPPWTVTSIEVESGDQVTWLAWGAAHLIKPLGISVSPSLVLCGRVARGGPVHRSPRDTHTFTADRAGTVELASLSPAGGELQPNGSIETDRLSYRAFGGSLSAVVVRWAPGSDPRVTLEALASRDASGLCAAEAARLADPPLPPPGWEPHPALGPQEIFAASPEGIAVDCRETVGIVRTPAQARLTPTLRLRWSWRLNALASDLPEDTTITHDYLSVALEFDDGQDLTWFWSSSLPVGFAYRCPLEHWRHRETHVVARSGTADLGRWVDEERPVLADHQAAIGGAPPPHVVRAWLIAVSGFQRGAAQGEFGRIELVDGDRTVSVL
jgi:hypothetical protein